jgi:hypothetical protein
MLHGVTSQKPVISVSIDVRAPNLQIRIRQPNSAAGLPCIIRVLTVGATAAICLRQGTQTVLVQQNISRVYRKEIMPALITKYHH